MNNDTTTNTPTTDYKLTTTQEKALQAIDNVIADVRSKFPSQIDQYRKFEEYAKSLSGSTNEAVRVNYLSALCGIPKDAVIATKAGVVNLGIAINQRNVGEPVTVEVTKADRPKKEAEPSDAELALATTFKTEIAVSDQIRGLTADDTRQLLSASHAATISTFKSLSTKENPVPDGAKDMVEFLIAASNGSTAPFEVTDKFIAEVAGVSTKTVIRNRQKLVEWMQATGKGIVDITQREKKPTVYKVNILEATTQVMLQMMNSNQASPESLLTVAALTGRLLTEGTERIQKAVSPAEFEQATEMAQHLTEAVDSIGKVKVKMTAQTEGIKKTAVTARFDKLTEAQGKALEATTVLELPDNAKDLNAFALDIRKAREAYEADEKATPDFDALEARLAELVKVNSDASRTQLEAAQEAKREAAASETPQTPKEQAAGYIAMLPDEHIDAERERMRDMFTEAINTLCVIAERTQNADDKKAVFLSLNNELQTVFGFGKGATNTAADAAA